MCFLYPFIYGHKLFFFCFVEFIVICVDWGRKQKNIQKPPSERVATNSPDVSAELKQVNALKKGVLEKIQEIDKQMKDLAKQVTTKVR